MSAKANYNPEPISLEEQVKLICFEVARLERDWAFFERAFVTEDEADTKRSAEVEAIEDHANELAFHLQELLQDAMILRLEKLSQKGSNKVSFPSVINRLDTTLDSVKALENRAADYHNAIRDEIAAYRHRRVAHLSVHDQSECRVIVRELQKLVDLASGLSRDLVKETGYDIPPIWPGWKFTSSRQFIRMLRHFAESHGYSGKLPAAGAAYD